MRKVTLEDAKEFCLFRSVCEKFRIAFQYWSKPGGVYIVEAEDAKLQEIGY